MNSSFQIWFLIQFSKFWCCYKICVCSISKLWLFGEMLKKIQNQNATYHRLIVQYLGPWKWKFVFYFFFTCSCYFWISEGGPTLYHMHMDPKCHSCDHNRHSNQFLRDSPLKLECFLRSLRTHLTMCWQMIRLIFFFGVLLFEMNRMGWNKNE